MCSGVSSLARQTQSVALFSRSTAKFCLFRGMVPSCISNIFSASSFSIVFILCHALLNLLSIFFSFLICVLKSENCPPLNQIVLFSAFVFFCLFSACSVKSGSVVFISELVFFLAIWKISCHF